MRKIKTVDKNKLIEVDVQLTDKPVQIPNIYAINFDKDNTLIIDSFFDIIDVVPNHLVDIVSKSIFIKDRYSQTQNPAGLELVLNRYRRSVSDDISAKRLVSFAICMTYSCNMKCIYCFERENVQKFRHMTSEELEIALSFIKHEIENTRKVTPDANIYFELFGGEPLQTKDKMLVERVFQFCREVNCPITITSNGYEIVNFIDSFVKYRDVIAFICVTLDGTEELHNARRVIKTGLGSFDQITKGIQMLLNLGFGVGAATNVDKENIDILQDIFAYYKANGWLENKKFLVEIGRVDDKYSSGNPAVISETEILLKLLEIFPNEVPRWLKVAFIKSTERVSAMLGVGLNQHEYGRSLFHHCWATSPIVEGCYIGPDLDMFRCTVTVANNNFLLGELGKDDYRSCYDSWMNQTCFSNPKCVNCNIGGFCAGGCAIEKKTKGFDAICKYEKENFDEFIRTIALPKLNSLL